MFKRVNVDGTKTLLDCALDSEVKKIIYVSTTMVFEPTGKMARDENWPKKTADGSNYYLKTKIEALAVVNRMKELLPIVVVYPTAVIDLKDFSASCPVDSAGLQKFLWEKIGRGIPGGLANLVGPKERILNYVIVEDVAEGIIKAAINAKPGEEYILGGENITAGDYLGAAAQRVNKRPFPFRLPFFLFRIMAFFGRFAGLPPVIAMIARNRSEDRCFSSRKAERELGYSPEFKL
jgi:nucleoside-diphosphate-sugar epimerase